MLVPTEHPAAEGSFRRDRLTINAEQGRGTQVKATGVQVLLAACGAASRLGGLCSTSSHGPAEAVEVLFVMDV